MLSKIALFFIGKELKAAFCSPKEGREGPLLVKPWLIWGKDAKVKRITSEKERQGIECARNRELSVIRYTY